MATDRDFVSLLRSIDGPSERLVEHLRRRPLTAVQPLIEPIGTQLWPVPEPAPRSLRILWIDDHPVNNAHLVEYFEMRGMRVEIATDRAEAVAAFRRFVPDAVLSDLRRGPDDQAGVTDLVHFRDVGVGYRGPVLFFVGRLPGPAVRKRIEELGAEGPTVHPHEVVRWVEQLESVTPARPG
ncbi:MAG: hypothetical protein QOI78_684 [Actinomycetota bacterium]|nr:hypothetical protein [Actinomycetota bacterium]